MKVLVLTTELRTGGTCRDAVEWANRLAESGHEVLVVAQSADDSGLRRLGSAVRFVSLGSSRALFASWRLMRILRTHPSAVVLANSGALAGVALVLRGLGLARNRIVFVDPFNPADSFRRDAKTALIYRWLLWKADAFVHLSFFAERIHLGLGLQRRRSHVIPNISSRRGTFRKPSPSSSALRLIAVGRLDKIKGFDRLIMAFGKVAERWPGATLRIIGEGYDRARLEGLVQAAGLTRCVSLPGHSDDVAGELREADLFILPSLYEGMPNTLVEALDQGLRVVASPCRGSVRSLMKSLEASRMVISEDCFEADLVRAIETALTLSDAEWTAIHARHRRIFDNEKNFQALMNLLAA